MISTKMPKFFYFMSKSEFQRLHNDSDKSLELKLIGQIFVIVQLAHVFPGFFRIFNKSVGSLVEVPKFWYGFWYQIKCYSLVPYGFILNYPHFSGAFWVLFMPQIFQVLAIVHVWPDGKRGRKKWKSRRMTTRQNILCAKIKREIYSLF